MSGARTSRRTQRRPGAAWPRRAPQASRRAPPPGEAAPPLPRRRTARWVAGRLHRQGAGAPRVLIVAGLDPSGEAGLVADLEAIRAAGARGWAVAAALTMQSARGARGFEPVSEATLLGQIEALLDGPERPAAVKTGMLGTGALARALADRLAAPPFARIPVVVDPVLAASAGISLLDTAGVPPGDALAPILARARLVTPNLPELAALTGGDVSTDAAAIRAARRLPSRAVLVKGGHREGDPVDLLVEGRRVTRLSGRRRPGGGRGTGCRLASAIAAYLARGVALEEAVRRAKRMVERYLDRATRA